MPAPLSRPPRSAGCCGRAQPAARASASPRQRRWGAARPSPALAIHGGSAFWRRPASQCRCVGVCGFKWMRYHAGIAPDALGKPSYSASAPQQQRRWRQPAPLAHCPHACCPLYARAPMSILLTTLLPLPKDWSSSRSHTSLLVHAFVPHLPCSRGRPRGGRPRPWRQGGAGDATAGAAGAGAERAQHAVWHRHEPVCQDQRWVDGMTGRASVLAGQG